MRKLLSHMGRQMRAPWSHLSFICVANASGLDELRVRRTRAVRLGGGCEHPGRNCYNLPHTRPRSSVDRATAS
jgi:hypothetical protein